MDDQQKAAYAALDRAIEMLTSGVMPDGHIVTDAVLIVGCQGITDEGHRVGGTGLFMKNGVQPVWITRALVNEAAKTLEHGICTCDD